MHSYPTALLLAFSLVCGSCSDSAASCADLDCDDGNPCSQDLCDPQTVLCENPPVEVATACEAGGEMGFCVIGQCAVMSCEGLVCDDENPCTVDGCFPDITACAAFVIPDGETCELEGLFGLCLGGTCNLEMPPSGEALLDVEVTGAEVDGVTYVLMCATDLSFSGFLSRQGNAWNGSLDLPAGDCQLTLQGRDANGEVICEGSATIEILPDTTTTLGLVLSCSS